jgi:hypothetical protein
VQVPARSTPVLPFLYAAACALWIVVQAKDTDRLSREYPAFERLLQAGQMTATEIPPRMFGLCQYELYDYAVSRDRPGQPAPHCGFYLGGTVVELDKEQAMRTSHPETCRPLHVPPGLLPAGSAPVRCQAPPPVLALDAGFKLRPLPLDDAGWRSAIAADAITFH